MAALTVVLTGATSGLGRALAMELAVRGDRVIAIGRDATRLAALADELPGGGHGGHVCDLSSVRQTQDLAQRIRASEPRLDMLINNAGAIFPQAAVTAERVEATFALNHLAGFVLANALVAPLRASPGAQVLCVASRAHRLARMSVAGLSSLAVETSGSGYAAYARSKLCNLLFAAELARRTGLDVRAAHPGVLATNFGGEATGARAALMRAAALWFGAPPSVGAASILQSLEGPRTLYSEAGRPARPSRRAEDPELARALWATSEATVQRILGSA